MATLSVRLPQALLAELDALVAEGRYPNRTAAAREALERLTTEARRRAVDQSIVDGYRDAPPEPPDDFDRGLAERAVAGEPW